MLIVIINAGTFSSVNIVIVPYIICIYIYIYHHDQIRRSSFIVIVTYIICIYISPWSDKEEQFYRHCHLHNLYIYISPWSDKEEQFYRHCHLHNLYIYISPWSDKEEQFYRHCPLHNLYIYIYISPWSDKEEQFYRHCHLHNLYIYISPWSDKEEQFYRHCHLHNLYIYISPWSDKEEQFYRHCHLHNLYIYISPWSDKEEQFSMGSQLSVRSSTSDNKSKPCKNHRPMIACRVPTLHNPLPIIKIVIIEWWWNVNIRFEVLHFIHTSSRYLGVKFNNAWFLKFFGLCLELTFSHVSNLQNIHKSVNQQLWRTHKFERYEPVFDIIRIWNLLLFFKTLANFQDL